MQKVNRTVEKIIKDSERKFKNKKNLVSFGSSFSKRKSSLDSDIDSPVSNNKPPIADQKWLMDLRKLVKKIKPISVKESSKNTI